MKPGVQTQRKARRIHRWLVPLAALPLLLTASTGSLYSLLLEQGIDAFWLLKVHTGQFGWINLQPVYPMLLGVLTILVTVSGLAMLLKTLQIRAIALLVRLIAFKYLCSAVVGDGHQGHF